MREFVARGASAAFLAVLLALATTSARADLTPELEALQLPETLAPEGIDIPEVSSSPDFDPLFDEESIEEIPTYDPLERSNRVIFGFNQQIDRIFWKPLSRGYRFLVPTPARRSVRRVFHNLNTPVFVVNNILQLRFLDAAESVGAFLLNSTMGWAGLFDVGKEAGLDSKETDFGQTLAMVGVGSGPFLMIPLLGPSTARDGFGDIVDIFFQPLTYILGPTPQILWGGGAGLARREAVGKKLEALEESALDFYSVLRSAYTQDRESLIRARRRELWWAKDDEEVTAEAAAPDVGAPAEPAASEPGTPEP